jgi:hypothetical protein
MAEFNDVKFCKHTEFTGSTFRDLVSFSHTTFLDVVDFNGASFMDIADFNNITFCSETDFKETVFHGFVRFVNTTFVGETDFTRASFNFEPPMFFNAKLHQGTVWRDVSWPIPSRDDDIDPGRFVDAYACLKLEMDRLKKHEDELDFFALEMQSRRWLVSFWHSILIWLYGLFCDYGRNYSRPLASLAITVIAGAIPFWWYFSVSTPPIFAHAVPTLSSVQALGLSFANTFNVLGIRKDFVDPEIIGTFPGWMKALAVTQTIIGVVMLFLFSLALRNRFRMR